MFMTHPTQVPELDPVQTYERLKRSDRHFFLDVRTVAEYQEVHASHVVHIPLDRLDPRKLVADHGVTPDTPIYVICRSGGRSYQGAMILKSAGFKEVYNVTGGTVAWVDMDLPINEETDEETSHQTID